MKNLATLTVLLVFVTCSAFQCNKQKDLKRYFKGKLEVKAACGRHTIALVHGNLDTSLVQASWTDSSTGKTYYNVFALANPCSFPSNDLNAGDEFYFTLGTKPQNCMTCMIYYPMPDKKLAITVVKIIHSKRNKSK